MKSTDLDVLQQMKDNPTDSSPQEAEAINRLLEHGLLRQGAVEDHGFLRIVLVPTLTGEYVLEHR